MNIENLMTLYSMIYSEVSMIAISEYGIQSELISVNTNEMNDYL